ncbi:SGNH hydrolase-type esterase domain-containing protein [Amylostereum chailletii]|nr:SGNH hydrolase-type esterase domain-containing protein [Amylostereum chailletii]
MAANCQDIVMLFGDSLTQGAWEHNGIGARLANIYARRFDVLNRGYSGFTTEWALPVFEQILAKKTEQPHVPPVRLLTIWFGANDACIKPSPQHVPLDQFITNLRAMIHLVTSPSSAHHSPQTKIILLTPPPINTIQRGADLASRDPPKELDRLFGVTRAYADAVRELGKTEGVPVVDAWTKLWEAAAKEEGNLGGFLTDGLHLNERGYKVRILDFFCSLY